MKIPTHYLLIPFLLLMVGFGGNSCSKEPSTSPAVDSGEPPVSSVQEILFIGNSHTYYNSGVFFHLAQFRKNDGSSMAPFIKESTFSGYSLQEHLSNAGTLAKLEERSWEAVVLQENTLVAATNGEATIAAIKDFQELLSKTGTKLYLFMTWPYKEEPQMYNAIKSTYEDAAGLTRATVVPVGTVWKSIQEDQAITVDLYDADGVHPNIMGTYLASALFYAAIYGKSPSGNTYTAGLEEETANYLKQKAGQ